jgi:hypothetical protein
MITSVHEVYVSKAADPTDKWVFWTYMICRVRAGHHRVYNLIRIDNLCDKMQCLGRELPLSHCRRIIREHQPEYKKK